MGQVSVLTSLDFAIGGNIPGGGIPGNIGGIPGGGIPGIPGGKAGGIPRGGMLIGGRPIGGITGGAREPAGERVRTGGAGVRSIRETTGGGRPLFDFDSDCNFTSKNFITLLL